MNPTVWSRLSLLAVLLPSLCLMPRAAAANPGSTGAGTERQERASDGSDPFIFYASAGLAPGVTLHRRGFHVTTRLNAEVGAGFRAPRRDITWTLSFAPALFAYFGRRPVGYAFDLVTTATFGPLYLRTGVGVSGGLPTGEQLRPYWHGLGGVAGAGFEFGRTRRFRLGIDYDLRGGFRGQLAQTYALAFRFVF